MKNKRSQVYPHFGELVILKTIRMSDFHLPGRGADIVSGDEGSWTMQEWYSYFECYFLSHVN